MSTTEPTSVVFTDGSVVNNCRKSKKAVGGIGVFFGKKDKRNISEPFLKFPITNQRAELYAILKAFMVYVENLPEKSDKTYNLTIVSDSQYAIKSLSIWKAMWKKRGWKKADGKDPLNMDIIFEFDKLEKLYEKKVNIKFRHIKAHTKQPKDKKSPEYRDWEANYIVDLLAKKGMMESQKI
jgi:ribonuclease HI